MPVGPRGAATAAALALLVGVGCSADDGAPCSEASAPTFAGQIAPLLETHCNGCHHSGKTAAARQGAPTGVDFDDEARFRPFAGLSLQRLAEKTHPGAIELSSCQLLTLRNYAKPAGSGGRDGGGGGSEGGPPPDSAPKPDTCPTCGTGACVDTSSDRAHCGACGKACPSGATCQASKCVCGTGLTLCDGKCVDTQSDAAHCGGCTKPCGSGLFCLAGKCNADCGSLTKCGSACVDTTASTLHCGGCDKPCVTGQTCQSSQCACAGGQTVCGGACVDTNNSAQHCGGCDKPCTGSGQTCNAGKCECSGGLTACGGSCVDTTSSDQHCGGCDKPCAGGKRCSNSACACGGTASFSKDVQPIYARTCATIGCHVGAVPKAGLDLSASVAYQATVGVTASQCNDGRKLVDTAGGPSYLLQKLLGVDLCFGSVMPKKGVSLPKSDIDKVGAWICNGAKND